jgi:hypothetical protein
VHYKTAHEPRDEQHGPGDDEFLVHNVLLKHRTSGQGDTVGAKEYAAAAGTQPRYTPSMTTRCEASPRMAPDKMVTAYSTAIAVAGAPASNLKGSLSIRVASISTQNPATPSPASVNSMAKVPARS